MDHFTVKNAKVQKGEKCCNTMRPEHWRCLVIWPRDWDTFAMPNFTVVWKEQWYREGFLTVGIMEDQCGGGQRTSKTSWKWGCMKQGGLAYIRQSFGQVVRTAKLHKGPAAWSRWIYWFEDQLYHTLNSGTDIGFIDWYRDHFYHPFSCETYWVDWLNAWLNSRIILIALEIIHQCPSLMFSDTKNLPNSRCANSRWQQLQSGLLWVD